MATATPVSQAGPPAGFTAPVTPSTLISAGPPLARSGAEEVEGASPIELSYVIL